jgi:hypothetical protein
MTGRRSCLFPREENDMALVKKSNALDGQAAIVTGASSGIGAAIPRAYAAAGAPVCVNY